MKNKTIFILPVFLLINLVTTAQKVYTKNGNVSFFSKSSMENIQADNNQLVSVFVPKTGDLQFSVLIKGFHFKKALMEEHFNESYMESDKYPKALFKGTITNMSKINVAADGVYTVEVTGDLTIHGVTQKVTTSGTLTIKSGIITATSKFKVKLADYKISIPAVVKNNIAEMIEINVSCVYDKKM